MPAANHLTSFDVFPIQLVLPRLIFFMGKEELFRLPLMDAVLRRLAGFPVFDVHPRRDAATELWGAYAQPPEGS